MTGHEDGVAGITGNAETRAVTLPSPVRRVVGLLRAVDAGHPGLWDVALAVAVACLTVRPVLNGDWLKSSSAHGVPVAVPWSVWLGFSMPLPWRRRHPFGVLLAMMVPVVVSFGYGVAATNVPGFIVALYEVARRSSMSRLAWAGVVSGAAIMADLLYWPVGGTATRLLTIALPATAAVLLGLFVRTRRAYIAALQERAARLETERDQQARLMAAAERTAIAAEMHDIIGHNLSVIASLADGGAYAARRIPERAVEALDAIGGTSRLALGELRRVLEVLRDGGAVGRTALLAPQPTLANLDELVARTRSAGLPVRFTVTGRPGELSPGYEMTVYRIVQESLTNVLKHAGAGREADLCVSYGPDGVAVTVTNTESTPDPVAGPDASGRGIAGMRERAILYQGTLEAGPLPSRRWRVSLWLPLHTP